MASSEYYIKCLDCGAKNKLPLNRLGKSPACGKCKQRLFSDNSPVSRGFVIIPCLQCQARNRVPAARLGEQPCCGKCRTSLTVNLNTNGRPVSLNDQSFTDKVLHSPLPSLVDFYSPNCGPCKLVNPVISKIAADFEGRLQVAMFNVDLNEHIPTLYRIGGTPTLLLFREGKELGRLEGYQSSATIVQWLRPYAW